MSAISTNVTAPPGCSEQPLTCAQPLTALFTPHSILALGGGNLIAWDASSCSRTFASCPSLRWTSVDSSKDRFPGFLLASTSTDVNSAGVSSAGGNVYLVKEDAATCTATPLLDDNFAVPANGVQIIAARLDAGGMYFSSTAGIYSLACTGEPGTTLTWHTCTPTLILATGSTTGIYGELTALALLPPAAGGKLLFGLNGYTTCSVDWVAGAQWALNNCGTAASSILRGVASIDRMGGTPLVEWRYSPNNVRHPAPRVRANAPSFTPHPFPPCSGTR